MRKKMITENPWRKEPCLEDLRYKSQSPRDKYCKFISKLANIIINLANDYLFNQHRTKYSHT